jgi:hypothetical protein
MSHVWDVMGEQTHKWVLALRTLSRVRGWSTRVQAHKELYW